MPPLRNFLFALLVLPVLATSARADTLGTIANDYGADLSLESFAKMSVIPAIGGGGLSFLDTLTFSIDQTSEVTLQGMSMNVDAFALAAPPAFTFDVGLPQMFLARAVLAPGSYTAALSGDVTGDAPGTYSFMAMAAAVIPEPATWMLFLAGAMMIAAVVMRRR